MAKYIVTWEGPGLVTGRDHFVAVCETREEAEARAAGLRRMPELYSDVKVKQPETHNLIL